MAHRVPPESRSPQLQRYYEKKKSHKKQPDSAYNAGVPRANLDKASPLQRRVAKSLYGKKAMCAREGIPYDLNSEWVLLQPDTCAVTGVRLVHDDANSPFAVNVDRIDPRKGYVMGNCRLVARWYNQAKQDWTDEQIQSLIVSAADFIKPSLDL